MPSIRWNIVLRNWPGSLRILLESTVLSVREILLRLARPLELRPLRLRNAIARIWIGTVFAKDHTILYSAGDTSGVERIADEKAEGYIVSAPGVPGTTSLQNADAVVLFAHGGGMIIGHPLQYLVDYERWVQAAQLEGKRIAFVAATYPLSTEAKWPAQRTGLINAYRWVLGQVPAAKVIMAGDSAGSNLVALTLLYLRDHGQNIAMPAGAVLMSPWVDMTAKETEDSPNFWNDFMFNFKEQTPMMNNALRPSELPYNTAEISAVLAADVGRLPPQLVLYSSTELLASDSLRWIARSREAGVEVVASDFPGEMHTFAVGWPMASRSVYRRSDELFIRFVLQRAGAG